MLSFRVLWPSDKLISPSSSTYNPLLFSLLYYLPRAPRTDFVGASLVPLYCLPFGACNHSCPAHHRFTSNPLILRLGWEWNLKHHDVSKLLQTMFCFISSSSTHRCVSRAGYASHHHLRIRVNISCMFPASMGGVPCPIQSPVTEIATSDPPIA